MSEHDDSLWCFDPRTTAHMLLCLLRIHKKVMAVHLKGKVLTDRCVLNFRRWGVQVDAGSNVRNIGVKCCSEKYAYFRIT
jgi:hypothetical protein